MNKKQRSRAVETARNIFFIVVAILVVVIFFNLDIIKKGESLFSRTAVTDIKFRGDLARTDYTDQEIDRLRDYLKIRKKLVQEITIQASPQDKYKAVKPNSTVLFEIHVVMRDGFTFSTPVRRAKRQDLSVKILSKLDKDVRAYLELKKQGKKAKGMINTM